MQKENQKWKLILKLSLRSVIRACKKYNINFDGILKELNKEK